MNTCQLNLPSCLYSALQKEAERLELDVDLLAAGLIKGFLNKQACSAQKPESRTAALCGDANTAGKSPGSFFQADRQTKDNPEPEKRRHERIKVDLSAMLFFKDEDGRSARYDSAGLKDVAKGGVLLEYPKNRPPNRNIAPGKQFELIFQLRDDEAPVHMQCEICRVAEDKEKTSLGVVFTGQDKDLSAGLIKILAEKVNKRS
ncbi:MAG: PilZ domain-containing protein [Desulfovibrio sp.]|jgi:hypothetical protein|nr:PilZ domain-containing protein [Desulfovibrio sp.]